MNYLNAIHLSTSLASNQINFESGLSSLNDILQTESGNEESSTTTNFNHTPINRLQNLSPIERLILINQIRSISNPRHQRAMRSYEISEEESSSQTSEEYIDFRTYPLTIDWYEIENDKGNYFSILEKYGYFGVGLYCSLMKKCKISLDIDDYISSLLNPFWEAYLNKTEPETLLSFMVGLPTLVSIKSMLSSGAILRKEKSLIKIVLDMYERFYLKYDTPCFNKLNKDYLITAETFYSECDNDELKEIWNILFNNSSEIKDKISKNITSHINRNYEI